MDHEATRQILVHKFEPDTDRDFVNYQTQSQRSLVHQPAKVTQMSSIVPTKFISLNTVVVSQAKPRLAESLVGAFTKFVG